MEEYNLKHQAFRHLIKSQFLKKITHVVLSVYLFTYFFPHTLPWHSFFNSFSYCFSTLPLRLITHTIDKNCMFILCNGILVLVVKNSGLISSSKSCKTSEYNNSSDIKLVTLDMKESLPASAELIYTASYEEVRTVDTFTDEEVGREYTFIDVMEEKNEHKESEVLVSEICKDEEKEIDSGRCYIENGTRDQEDKGKEQDVVEVKEEEEYEAVNNSDNGDDNCDEKIGEGNAGLSTDELNKKFDEFIQRMKEELRIEARQHLVMV